VYTGWALRKLRHSAATHLCQNNVPIQAITGKTLGRKQTIRRQLPTRACALTDVSPLPICAPTTKIPDARIIVRPRSIRPSRLHPDRHVTKLPFERIDTRARASALTPGKGSATFSALTYVRTDANTIHLCP
jgi:hypothetical protein